MRQNRLSITAAPAVYVILAIAVVLLPLKLLIAWILSVLFHEICHILSVFLCGGHVNKIRFALTGAQISAYDLNSYKEIICLLAGPCGSFLLLLLFRWYPQIAFFGLIHGIINMLPLVNLDGGKALQCILRLRMNETLVQKISALIDRVMRIMLCLLGLLAAWKLSWTALGVLSCIYFLPWKKIKYPCKQRTQQVQYR